MDIHQRLQSSRSHLLILIILSLLSTNSFLTTANSARVYEEEEEKVNLEFYYETLCPYCSIFFHDYLYKIFDNGLIDIINLKLIPYGNAKIRANGTIVCQHGQDECLLNTIEACAIHAWPDVHEHFPFIYCVESLVYNGQYIQWGTCFENVGLDRKPVDECYTNGLGKQLELGFATETNALQPPHEYVPWITVDGQPLYDDYPEFISFVCKAYKGTPLPPACVGSSTGDLIKKKTTTSACFTGENIKLKFSSVRSAMKSWMQQGVTTRVALA